MKSTRFSANFGRAVATLLIWLSTAGWARADIYQWEFIDPANPSLGKQQSSMLCVDGANVNAAPFVDLADRDLTKAYLTGANLNFAKASWVNLTNADLSGANLTGGYFLQARLIDADLRRADLRDANFYGAALDGADLSGTNLKSATFQSARLSNANFVAANLTDAFFEYADMTGADLSDSNLINSDVRFAALNGANLSQADVRWADLRNTTWSGFAPAQLYSTASYQAGDLTGTDLGYNDLRGWNFADQNLTDARFDNAMLASANFSGAKVNGAYLAGTTRDGFTAAQLYSTASYRDGDLTRVSLSYNELGGWNFAGQNLTGAFFHQAILTGANFNGADVREAYLREVTRNGFTAAQLYSTASYQAGDLTGIDLSDNFLGGWNFAGQNLTNANFSSAWLRGADFTGAEVRGADFRNTTGHLGFTGQQLYSTASYQAGNLAGINLRLNNLDGWNLAGQNLTNASFASATLNGANLMGADLRGAIITHWSWPNLNTENMIQHDGDIAGLDLRGGRTLLVRDYDGYPEQPPSPFAAMLIRIHEHMIMDGSGKLKLVFEADAWDSLISLREGIAVELDGVLELAFAPEVNIASQLRRTIRIFDWNGVSPMGKFDVVSAHTWDLSRLYTTGEITLVPEPSAAIATALGAFVVGIMVRWRRSLREKRCHDTASRNHSPKYPARN